VYRSTISKPPYWARLFAVVLALAPFLALWFQSAHRVVEHTPPRAVLIPIIERAATRGPPSAVVAPAPATLPRQRPWPRAAPAVPAQAIEAQAKQERSPVQEPSAPVAAIPASAPLNLEPSVLRSAAHASKGELRKLAESSGAYAGDEPTSKSQALAQAVASSTRPDCLAPNENGSLLSAFVIAYQAANGKCK
jgi:hypothetical protein